MTKEKRSSPRRRPPTALDSAVELVMAGIAVAAAVLALVGPRRATPPIVEEEPSRPRPRPLTAVECAQALVIAGLAIATVMLALAGSARASSSATLPVGNFYLEGPPVAIPYARAAAAVRPPVETPLARAPAISPALLPGSTPTPAAEFMPMPVEGLWRVTCGYRCVLHDEEHISTFAVDIMLAEGETAGQPVRSPVAGRVITVEDSSTYFCGGEEIEGPEAGGVIIIDFRAPSGLPQRLRLAHIDPASIPDELRPDGRPVPLDAGTLLGSVADLDRCSHLHVSVTRVEGRREVPKPLVIEGTPLEDCGGDDCWNGALIPPESP